MMQMIDALRGLGGGGSKQVPEQNTGSLTPEPVL